MADYTEIFPAKLPNGATIKVEVSSERKGQEVVLGKLKELDFQDFTNAIEGMVDAVAKTLNKVKPDKAKVELGVDFSLEAGKLTALIAKGTGNASIKLTLEWERERS